MIELPIVILVVIGYVGFLAGRGYERAEITHLNNISTTTQAKTSDRAV